MNDPIKIFSECMRTGVLNESIYDKMTDEEVINKYRTVGAKRFKKKKIKKKMADKSKRRNR